MSIEEETDVLVLDYKLKLSHSVDALPEDIKLFFVDQDAKELICASSDWVQQSYLDAELQHIFEYLLELNIKVKGTLLVFQRIRTEGQSTLGGRYVLDGGSVTFENCDLRISAKVPSQQTQRFTEDDKKQLFVEYWETYKRVPRATEKYKGFGIGAYYHTAKKNKKLFDDLTQTMGGDPEQE